MEDIGYQASVKVSGAQKRADKPVNIPMDKQAGAALTEAQSLKNRLMVSLLFTIPLFYLSMGEMLRWPLPAFLSGMENAMVYAFTLFLLTLPVLYTGKAYFRNGFKTSCICRPPWIR